MFSKIKYLVMVSFTLFQISAFADCNDQYEAQIIAEIVSVKTDSMTYCKAMLSRESISHFREHILCPLDLAEIIENGIDFSLVNGHDCELTKGDTVSGVLVQSNGKIRFDN